MTILLLRRFKQRPSVVLHRVVAPDVRIGTYRSLSQQHGSVDLDDGACRQLRARLILAGQTVSQWVREQIKRFLRGS
jgi:hypothetical protein